MKDYAFHKEDTDMTVKQFNGKCDELVKMEKEIRVLETELEDKSNSIELLSAILDKLISLRILSLTLTETLVNDINGRKSSLEKVANILTKR